MYPGLLVQVWDLTGSNRYFHSAKTKILFDGYQLWYVRIIRPTVPQVLVRLRRAKHNQRRPRNIYPGGR